MARIISASSDGLEFFPPDEDELLPNEFALLEDEYDEDVEQPNFLDEHKGEN